MLVIDECGNVIRVVPKDWPVKKTSKEIQAVEGSLQLLSSNIEGAASLVNSLSKRLATAERLLEVRTRERDAVKTAHRHKSQQVTALRERIDMLKLDVEIANDKVQEMGGEVEEEEEEEEEDSEDSVITETPPKRLAAAARPVKKS